MATRALVAVPGLAAVLALVAAACGPEPPGVAVGEGKLVADEEAYPGDAGPLLGDIARTDEEADELWETVGFSVQPPALDDQALVVVTGGQPDDCPWDPTVLSVDATAVVVALADLDEERFCEGDWTPRALALTVPAADVTADSQVHVRQPWGETESASPLADRPDPERWDARALATDDVDDVGGCGDAFVFATTPGDAVLVAVRWDGAASRALDDGAFAAERDLPDDEVSVGLQVGSDLSMGHCTDALFAGRPLLAGEWEAVSGQVEITVEADDDAHADAPHGTATLTLQDVELEAGEGTAGDPWRIDQLEIRDVVVGWAPG